MAKIVSTEAFLSLAAWDGTNWLVEVTLDSDVGEEDSTTMGSSGAEDVEAGLKKLSLSATFTQDYAAGGPDVTLAPLHGTKVAFIYRPKKSVVRGPTNPEYSGTILLKYQPLLSTKPGGLQKCSISGKGAPAILTRNIA